MSAARKQSYDIALSQTTSNSSFLSDAPYSVIIRKLPNFTTPETLRSMLIWSKELVDSDILPPNPTEDPGYLSAILRFKTLAGAQEAKSMLDGKPNLANDAKMTVELLFTSPIVPRRYPTDIPATNNAGPASSNSSTASSAGPTPRQSSRFTGAFQSMERVSPPSSTYHANELPNPKESNTHYQSIFSPQSPIGNHLNDRTRISGKSLINNDSTEDDETGELLKDPVGYAEHGPSSMLARRATNPQLPIGRLSGLSLNTSTNGTSAGMSAYTTQTMSAVQSQASAMSPTAMTPNSMANGGQPVNYQLGSQHYNRHNFPPVNPADQNPPCNTLYVGNLPIDTSEDELKAMFSKQRGYKRLCFRTKQNGPMCFVEFEDVSFATKALHELYGHPLHNSVKGGIRLSFSKNPLGVRSGQGAGTPGPITPTVGMQGLTGMMNGMSFVTANGPPPGLAAPPGLVQTRSSFSGNLPTLNGGANQFNSNGFSGNGWNGGSFSGAMTAGGPASMAGNVNSGFPPAYMMGR